MVKSGGIQNEAALIVAPNPDSPSAVEITPQNLYSAVCLFVAQYPEYGPIPPRASVWGRWHQLPVGLVVQGDDGKFSVMLGTQLDSRMIFMGTDQPEMCRSCGARTNWIATDGAIQLHTCQNCAVAYLVEDDHEA